MEFHHQGFIMQMDAMYLFWQLGTPYYKSLKSFLKRTLEIMQTGTKCTCHCFFIYIKILEAEQQQQKETTNYQ